MSTYCETSDVSIREDDVAAETREDCVAVETCRHSLRCHDRDKTPMVIGDKCN